MGELPSDVSHRLPLIKHVLSSAVDDARLPEPFCSHAILELHDAVELFAQFLAEHIGVTMSRKADFLEYWPALTKALGRTFPKQVVMKRLNQARVGLKHSGVRPSRADVDDLAAQTITFMDEASRLVFRVPFGELSSVSLVGYEPAQGRLRQAEHFADCGDFLDASEMCALAFNETMYMFRTKSGDKWNYSPFPNLSRVTRHNSSFMQHEWDRQNRHLVSHLEKLSEAFAEIEPVLLMLTLGIEYRQFARFRDVTPSIIAMADGSLVVRTDSRRTPTGRDVLFAIDFAIQAALRLREIDPEAPDSAGTAPFQSERVFAISMPGRNRANGYQIHGFLTEIGGGFEAWIRHDGRLERIRRGENRPKTEEYLEDYKRRRLQNSGGSTETPSVT